jgi:hypothetical protein
VGALLRGDRIGVSRNEAQQELGLALDPEASRASSPAPAEPARGSAPCAPTPARACAEPAESPRGRPSWTLGLGLAYEVGAYASTGPEHGPAASLSLVRSVGASSVGLTLLGQHRFPITKIGDPSTLRLESDALRVLAFATLSRIGRVEPRVFAGGGVDVVRAEPGLLRVVDATLRPSTRFDPVFRAGVGFRFPVGALPGACFELGAGVDLAPFVASYAVARDGLANDLIAPWAVRPLVLVGLGLDPLSKN